MTDIFKDIEFLDEEISRYPCYGSRVEVVTVREIIARCYNYFTKKIGTGILTLSNHRCVNSLIFGGKD